MIGFQSSPPTEAQPVDAAIPPDTLTLQFGAVASIRTSGRGHGNITFNKHGEFSGPWSYDKLPCHAKGRIKIDRQIRWATVDLTISHNERPLFNGQLVFDVRLGI